MIDQDQTTHALSVGETAYQGIAFGLHDNISHADYHADRLMDGPTLSRSCAATMLAQSARHGWSQHPKLGGVVKPSNNEMDFGDVCHQLFLGKGSGVAIFEGKTWQGKEASAFWDKAVEAGQTPIKRADHTRAMTAVSEWHRQLFDMGLDYAFGASGQTEVTALWNEAENCNARARLDWLRLGTDNYEIWDLKTTESAAPKKIDRAIGNMGYDLQEAFYLRAVWQSRPELMGRGKFRFLFAETVAPFAILPYETDGMAKSFGEQKAQEAFALWASCIKTGCWPSYSTGIYRGETPAYLSPKNTL